jgi:outer membrane protein insertion porin family
MIVLRYLWFNSDIHSKLQFFRYKYSYILFVTILFASGCKSLKLKLNDENPILYKTIINGNKNISTAELEEYRKQIPNRNFLGTTPYITFYKLGKLYFKPEKFDRKIEKTTVKYESKLSNLKDSVEIIKLTENYRKKVDKYTTHKKEGNWLMRSVGEAPVYYDSLLTRESARQMRAFLKSNGYYNSKVNFNTTRIANRTFLTYSIDEGKPYRINNVEYQTSDKTILKYLLNDSKNGFLKKNDIYTENNISLERDRIDKLLKNNGYFNFNKQYILFEIDTNLNNNTLNVYTIINNPDENNQHQQFIINNVYFTTDASLNFPNYERDTLQDAGINFIGYNFQTAKKLNRSYYRHHLIYYKFSPKLLNRRIEIAPKEFYSLEKSVNTQRQLANLDMFKFININYINVSDTTNKLDVYIRSNPFPKYQLSDELGISVSQQLPGPFGNISFKARNTLHQNEIFDFNLFGSIEGQASFLEADNVYRTQVLGVSSGLTFPKVFTPLNLLDQTKLMRKFNARTRIGIGYNYVNRPEYSRNILDISARYFFQKGKYSTFTFSPLDINIINSHLQPEFNSFLESLSERGNNLNLSFRPSFVTSMSGSYTYNTSEMGKNKYARYFRIFFESGGTSLNLLNKTFFAENDSLFGLLYFRFIKAQVDYRHYIPIKKYQTMAFRINLGAVLPYDKVKRLPYEKYFFTGGSNSIRAWRPRRLGPGAFTPQLTENGEFDYRFEQPGEIVIEASAEYRFKIINFIRGALFVDAGNIWMLNEDETRPGSKFYWNKFHHEIAVGTGFGLRFDFSFLVIRLDLGVKVYDPALPLKDRLIIDNIRPSYDNLRQKGVINIGIGYPF